MATRQVIPGGHFAPPLTDALLKKYKTLAEAMPAGAPKEAVLACLKCCERWWALPEPNGTETAEHPSGRGTIVTLQKEHAKELDDLIPWQHELNAWAGSPDGKLGLFDELDTEANHRNGEKARDWNLAVMNHVIAECYPDDPGEYDRVWGAIHTEDRWLPSVSDAEKAKHAERKKKAEDCCKKIVDAVSSKNYPAVPRPAMEPTPTRDMALHLCWHVRELDLGREPITVDRLGK